MEVTFKGLTLNVANNYLIVEIDGWESMPDVTNGSTPKPTRNGSQLGGLTSPERVITVTVDILGDPENEYLTTVPKRKLRQVMTLNDAESELKVDLGFGLPVEIAFARVTALELPTGAAYGHKQRVVIEFTATDPRRYSPVTNSARTGLPTPVRGVPYPIRYGKYATVLTPSNKGEAVLQNTGNFETPAIYQVTGPSPKPSITVTNGSLIRRTYFNLPLGDREVLRVDTATGAVTVNGAARYGIASGALVEDLGLPPGDCAVALGGGGNDNTSLSVTWRDANI